jgi:hypothetical protein
MKLRTQGPNGAQASADPAMAEHIDALHAFLVGLVMTGEVSCTLLPPVLFRVDNQQ